MLTLINIVKVFKYGLTGLLLFIDSIVYWAISMLFKIFEAIAGAEIITQSEYQDIANKFYVIIGVVTLFYLTYTLLKTLINPDDFNKNIGKIVINLVTSLILLGIVPFLFSYAFSIQKAVMADNIIGNLVLGRVDIPEDTTVNPNSISYQGNLEALSILTTFLNPEGEDIGSSNGESITFREYLSRSLILGPASVSSVVISNELEGDEESGTTWSSFIQSVVTDGPTAFFKIVDFAEAVANGDASYLPIVSTLCGGFIVYVLVSFCIDLGIRVVKLAFYQIIAPIPILMRIIPEKKSVFDNWVKGTIAAFMEVFIRIFIIFLVVFLVRLVFGNGTIFNNDIGFVGNVIIALGLFAFAKQAPKLFSDMLGINSGNIKLGIGGKLAAGGAFGIGAVLGGGLTAGVRNLTHLGGNTFDALKNKNYRAAWQNASRIPGSFVAGGFSGAVHSGKSGFSAKNFKDMARAAGQGAVAAVNKRDDRETFRANHGNTLAGVAKGHVQGLGVSIANWATGSGAGILKKVEWEEKFKDLFSDYQAIYENPKYNAMDAELQKMKSLQAAGVQSYEGQNIVNAINSLEAKMLESRLDAMRKDKKNTQSIAYAMYNIANMAKGNPSLAQSIGINVDKADDLKLQGGRIIDKTTGKEIEANKLFSMIEGSALNGIKWNGAKYVDSHGQDADFGAIVNLQESIKDGMKDQKKKAADAAKADRVSIEYKEAQKRQEASKK